MQILALDEGPFPKDSLSKQTLLVACVIDQHRILRLAFSTVTIDGKDGTKRAIQLLKRCGNYHLILLGSVSVAGFNVVDPFAINDTLRTSVIVANSQRPHPQLVKLALQRHFDDWAERLRVFERTNLVHQVTLTEGNILYYRSIGLDTDSARRLLREITVLGKTPEPLRVARIFARTLGRWSFPQVRGNLR